MDFFKKDGSRGEVFSLSESHPHYERYSEFKNIINNNLEQSKKSDFDIIHDQVEFGDIKDSKYLIDMYIEISKATYYILDIKDIRNIDYKNMGYVDYVHKFAFELAEREQELTKEMMEGSRDDYKRKV